MIAFGSVVRVGRATGIQMGDYQDAEELQVEKEKEGKTNVSSMMRLQAKGR